MNIFDIIVYIAMFMAGIALIGCVLCIYDIATNFRFSLYIISKLEKKSEQQN